MRHLELNPPTARARRKSEGQFWVIGLTLLKTAAVTSPAD
jgi:hypothetical protein